MTRAATLWFFFKFHSLDGRPESAASVRPFVVAMRREATAATATATTTSDGSGSVTLESILRALSARNQEQQQPRHRETTSESRRGGESDAFAVNLRRQLPALMTLLNPVNGARASDGCAR